MPCKIWSLKIEFFRSLIFWVHQKILVNYHWGWSCSICRRASAPVGLSESNMWLGMKILQNKITGTQTSFSTNFGCKLSCILSFCIGFGCPIRMIDPYSEWHSPNPHSTMSHRPEFHFGVRSSIQRAHYSAPIRHIGTSRGLRFWVHFFIFFTLKKYDSNTYKRILSKKWP